MPKRGGAPAHGAEVLPDIRRQVARRRVAETAYVLGSESRVAPKMVKR